MAFLPTRNIRNCVSHSWETIFRSSRFVSQMKTVSSLLYLLRMKPYRSVEQVIWRAEYLNYQMSGQYEEQEIEILRLPTFFLRRQILPLVASCDNRSNMNVVIIGLDEHRNLKQKFRFFHESSSLATDHLPATQSVRKRSPLEILLLWRTQDVNFTLDAKRMQKTLVLSREIFYVQYWQRFVRCFKRTSALLLNKLRTDKQNAHRNNISEHFQARTHW